MIFLGSADCLEQDFKDYKEGQDLASLPLARSVFHEKSELRSIRLKLINGISVRVIFLGSANYLEQDFEDYKEGKTWLDLIQQ